MNMMIFLLIALFGGVLLVRIFYLSWTLDSLMAKLLNLQHAKIMFSKVEVQCKPEILNGSVSYVNTQSGISMNMTIDIKQELDNIAVIFIQEHG